MLTDRLGHLARHGECSGGCGGNDARGVFGVGRPIGLREFEGREIATCVVPVVLAVIEERDSRSKAVRVDFEKVAMRIEL